MTWEEEALFARHQTYDGGVCWGSAALVQVRRHHVRGGYCTLQRGAYHSLSTARQPLHSAHRKRWAEPHRMADSRSHLGIYVVLNHCED